MTTSLSFPIPLTQEAHQIARQRSDSQLSPKRAQQVYLNSLAVYATHFYLQCMEIESDFAVKEEGSRAMVNAFSSIELLGLGQLECCPIQVREKTVRIPAETWGDRLGYMVVQLNESLSTANLLGFLKTPTTEIVTIDQLDSLEVFLTYVTDLEQSAPAPAPVELFQWWYDTVESGWETLESLFPKTQLAWRNSPVSNDRSPSVNSSVTRAKVLDLATHDRVALVLEILPLNHSETEIWVEVYPLTPWIFLPETLKLSILDDQGSEVIFAEARTTENIQIKFIADSGERFAVQVALEEVSMTESFLV